MTTMTTPITPYVLAKKRDTFWDFTGRLIAGAFKAILLVLVIAILTRLSFSPGGQASRCK